jgi:BirA family biotin operon repressor/biotin-[acetyl-CoA-carboxylase] ligase
VNSGTAKTVEFGGGPYRHALEDARDRLGRLASLVIFHPCIGSTNDAAMAVVRQWPVGSHTLDVPEGAVIVADEQNAGRGRQGHTWSSPAGRGLYVSVLLTPSRTASDARRATALLTLAAGVAIVEAIEAAASLSADLKWPNDVYVGRRKLAGILAEAVNDTTWGPTIVLGYGINVLATEWPPAVAQRATSIESEIGRAIPRDRLFVETLAALSRRYDDLLAGRFDAILDAWRRRSPSANGTQVEWTDASGEHAGITTGIDDQGALLVREKQDIHRLLAGELRWHLNLEP